MALKFTSDVESRLTELVRSGDFADENDAINQAILLLEERQRKLEHLREIVAEAQQEVAAGHTVLATPELFRTIREEAIRSIDAGENFEIDPNVWPLDER